MADPVHQIASIISDHPRAEVLDQHSEEKTTNDGEIREVRRLEVDLSGEDDELLERISDITQDEKDLSRGTKQESGTGYRTTVFTHSQFLGHDMHPPERAREDIEKRYRNG